MYFHFFSFLHIYAHAVHTYITCLVGVKKFPIVIYLHLSWQSLEVFWSIEHLTLFSCNSTSFLILKVIGGLWIVGSNKFREHVGLVNSTSDCSIWLEYNCWKVWTSCSEGRFLISQPRVHSTEESFIFCSRSTRKYLASTLFAPAWDFTTGDLLA